MKVLCLSNFAAAGFIGFQGDASIYNNGSTDWQVVEMYAEFDTTGTESVSNICNADIKTSDSLGFNHNDLADSQGGSWKPSFSFEITGLYNPLRDSYVTVGYGVGASAALNQTSLDPNFGTGTGVNIPLNAGWFNLTPASAQFATPRLKIGQFVWEVSRSASFTFSAGIGYKDANGNVAFGSGSFSFPESSGSSSPSSGGVVPEPTSLAMFGIGALGLVGTRRRRK